MATPKGAKSALKKKRLSPIRIEDHKRYGYKVRWMAGNRYMELAGSVQGINTRRETEKNILALIYGVHGLYIKEQIHDHTKKQLFVASGFAIKGPKQQRKRQAKKA